MGWTAFRNRMKREVFHISASDVLPAIPAVLAMQGIPRHVHPDERITLLARDAIVLFEKMAHPVGILMEIGTEDFATVFQGEAQNDDESPVMSIARSADRLALFAVTIGQPLCAHIGQLFRDDELPLGAMLDAAASEGTELTASMLEARYRERLRTEGAITRDHGTLRFSPGYCGWHVSGQMKLFQALEPAAIGIRLNDSCLMNPLKSISGVVIAGRKHIFDFEDTFPFCRDCADHACRDRFRELSAQ